MKLSGTRTAGKADSWYEGDAEVLSDQLDDFLSKVPTSINDTHLPISGAKVIIAPYVVIHAQPIKSGC
jgi:predicted class III extradiol MEMO1 family dioxygenase